MALLKLYRGCMNATFHRMGRLGEVALNKALTSVQRYDECISPRESFSKKEKMPELPRHPNPEYRCIPQTILLSKATHQQHPTRTEFTFIGLT